MKKSFIFSLIFGLFFAVITFASFNNKSFASNNYPVVFVNGLTGWGRGEAGDNLYWGGKTTDLIKDLNYGSESDRPNALEGTVSPYSSDYDRAVELYYYIKGGTVDYGQAHADQYGHSRYGRTFQGIYPSWDGTNKLHLLGHSMGGQTVRELDTLLRDGSPAEVQATGDQTSSLFQGGKNWVDSVTTVATPSNGTPTATDVGNLRVVRHLLYTGALVGAKVPLVVPSADYKLDQWGLRRNQGQSMIDYIGTALKSRIWSTNDNSLYDLTSNGATAINNRTNLSPDVHYFTYSGLATKPNAFGRYVPISTMNKVDKIGAAFIGAAGNDPRWWPNDGEVPVISAQFPIGQAAVRDDVTDDSQTGEWQYNDPENGWDHKDFVLQDYDQASSLRNSIVGFYDNIVRKLHAL
ncbi:lipase [Companilactobacillus mishanensis]|uniref:triacylglycerol lipase n=1 Tax=Companilactobacillus mishanensis TaxID=2486008 RepID=A0A5P0ZFE3_9LACO|nr:lipase [Companilactobacillus mishanensis]MQS51766.1 lipase [Companilactobacillus mishanensis]